MKYIILFWVCLCIALVGTFTISSYLPRPQEPNIPTIPLPTAPLPPPSDNFLLVLCEIDQLHDRLYTLENPPDAPQSTNPSPDTIMASIVHVRGSAGWQGSGVYVGDGLILTAGHIIKDSNSFILLFENDANLISTTYYLEPVADIGFIYLSDQNDLPPPIPFSSTPSVRGDTTFIYGNPFGTDFKFSVTRGIISAINRDTKNLHGSKLLIQTDAAAYSGDSGGPAINPAGEIVGICVGGGRGYNHITLCIPAAICRQSKHTYLSILSMEKLK